MLDVPCSETVQFFKINEGRKITIGLISGTSGVSHKKEGMGKQFYKSGILQLRLERVPPGNEICCESPECVRMSLGQAWRPQDGRRKWLSPQDQQSQGYQSNVSSSHEEKGRGHWALWVIERSKLRKTKKKKGNVCQGHSRLDQSWFPTDKSGYLVGFEVYALKQREEEMWPFQLYIKEVYGRRSGRTTPAAQPSTLHLGFLPTDCTEAMEEITVAGGTQRMKITTATDTIYWIPRIPGGLSSKGPHRVGHDWSDLAAAAALWWQVFCWAFLHLLYLFLIIYKINSVTPILQLKKHKSRIKKKNPNPRLHSF